MYKYYDLWSQPVLLHFHSLRDFIYDIATLSQINEWACCAEKCCNLPLLVLPTWSEEWDSLCILNPSSTIALIFSWVLMTPMSREYFGIIICARLQNKFPQLYLVLWITDEISCWRSLWDPFIWVWKTVLLQNLIFYLYFPTHFHSNVC